MTDEPLSRRGLFSLSWARRGAPRADLRPYKAALREGWEAGGGALAAAWAPLAGQVCDLGGAEPGRWLLAVADADGALAAEAAGRGAIVTAVHDAPSLVESGRARTEEAGGDVLWEVADPDALPFPDGFYDAVVSVYGAAFAPRARRAARELLRVLAPDGVLVLAVPAPGSFLERALELAAPYPEGVPSPAAWGDPAVASGRIDTAAPGMAVEVRETGYTLAFASEASAWAACSGPLGLPDAARERFADLVTARSSARASVRIDERATVIVARREG